MPRDASLTATVTPGRTAPVASATRPRISPLVAWDCEKMGAAKARNPASTRAVRRARSLTFTLLRPAPGRGHGPSREGRWGLPGDRRSGRSGPFPRPPEPRKTASSLWAEADIIAALGREGLVKVLLPHDTIQSRIREMGREIARDYAGRDPHLVGVLKGACTFMSNLAQAVDLPLTLDYIAVS